MVLVTVTILPYLKYFPLNFNNYVNVFFYDYSFIISIIIIVSLTLIFLMKRTRFKLILITIVLFQVFFNNVFQNICNNFIIYINTNKKVENFKNPFLGVKMNKYEDGASFHYDNLFHHKSLIYKNGHNIKKEDLLNNFELTQIIKIYNEDWYSTIVP